MLFLNNTIHPNTGLQDESVIHYSPNKNVNITCTYGNEVSELDAYITISNETVSLTSQDPPGVTFVQHSITSEGGHSNLTVTVHLSAEKNGSLARCCTRVDGCDNGTTYCLIINGVYNTRGLIYFACTCIYYSTFLGWTV